LWTALRKRRKNMNKKVKTVLAFGVGFFVGSYATTAVEDWLCREGRMYAYFKVGDREYGDRKIVPPSSTTEEEVSE
jgi:hypothetical protein